MNDLISRREAIEWCLEGLSNMPSAVQTGIKGQWLDGHRVGYGTTLHWYIYCSECLHEREDDNHDKDTPYCPWCGVEMKVD